MQLFVYFCLTPYFLLSVTAVAIDSDKIHVMSQNIEPKAQKVAEGLHTFAQFKSKRLTKNVKLDPRQIDVLVQEFYAKLRSFILDSHFDTYRFGRMAANLSEEWQKIVEITTGCLPPVSRLAHQRQFVSSVFEQMKRSAKFLTSFDYVGTAVNYLLNRVVDLNIRLFAFYNSNGFPDTQIPAYSERFNSCWRELLHYNESCRNLPNISTSLREFFEDRLSQASLIANFLRRSS